MLMDDDEMKIDPPPTGMTYFLGKVRLAHISREMADTVPLETTKLLQTPYEHIIAIDNTLESFILNLPFFFRFDAESRNKTRPLETIYPNIPLLRYHITTAAYIKRCQLHRNFLLQKFSDQIYTFSRRACIESAGAVIQGYEILREYYSPCSLTAHLGICVRYTYLALAILIMDLCFNRDEMNKTDIKARVKAALQMFEDAKDVSPLPGQFLSSLRDILQNHKVDFADLSNSQTTHGDHSGHGTESGISNPIANERESIQVGLDTIDSGLALETSFDEFWEMAIQSEPNLDSNTWDNLFSALDSRPL
jgi:hypothetical protein